YRLSRRLARVLGSGQRTKCASGAESAVPVPRRVRITGLYPALRAALATCHVCIAIAPLRSVVKVSPLQLARNKRLSCAVHGATPINRPPPERLPSSPLHPAGTPEPKRGEHQQTCGSRETPRQSTRATPLRWLRGHLPRAHRLPAGATGRSSLRRRTEERPLEPGHSPVGLERRPGRLSPLGGRMPTRAL